MTTHDDSGFTLMETMIALGVLTVGLLSVAQMMAFGFTTMTASGEDMIARQKASEAIESVYTARDTRTVTWDRIRNVLGQSGADGGVFLDGLQPLTLAGADGLLNTADDGAVEGLIRPGLDGQLGTADDTMAPLAGFQREIMIRDVGPNLRSLRVRILYRSGRMNRQYVIDTLISSFA